MVQEEKDRIIALFDQSDRWCRGVDAKDTRGDAVHYDDEAAVSWDIVGGLCHLFGWKRACQLFGPMSRHIAGQRKMQMPSPNQEITAMSVLLDFNDDDDTTHELIMDRLRRMPVWHGRRSSI